MIDYLLLSILITTNISYTNDWTENDKKTFLEVCHLTNEQSAALLDHEIELYCNCALYKTINLFPDAPPRPDQLSMVKDDIRIDCFIIAYFEDEDELASIRKGNQSNESLVPTHNSPESIDPLLESLKEIEKRHGVKAAPFEARETEGVERLKEGNIMFVLIFIIGMIPAVVLRIILTKYDKTLPEVATIFIGMFFYLAVMAILELSEFRNGNPAIIGASIGLVSMIVLWGRRPSKMKSQELNEELEHNDTAVKYENHKNHEKSEIDNSKSNTITFQNESSVMTKKNELNRGLKGVGGWLTVFCISLTIIIPLVGIGQLYNSWQEIKPVFELYPILESAAWLETLTIIGIMVYGFFVGIMIWSGNKDGKLIAEKYLKIRLSVFIIAEFLILLIVSGDAFIRSIMIEGVATAILAELVFFGVWFSYFKKSKRVANTYYKNEPLTHPETNNAIVRHREKPLVRLEKPLTKQKDENVEFSDKQKKTLQIQIKNELISFEFDLHPDKTIFYTNDTLTRNEAKEISEKLDERYPRLIFEVKDVSDQDDPFAPLQLGIVGKIKG